MNNNKSDEAALLAGCKGVFSKASYVTIGTTEKPEEYIKKLPLRSVYKDKQFAGAPPKEGRTVDTYFEKKHNWISDNDKYVDRQRYNGQEKKKGFLTSDFSKRDEFSNTIRTEQWREQLTQEDKHAKKALHLFTEKTGGMPSAETFSAKPQEPDTYLYDLVFEKDDPNFSGASKTHRDTKNRTHLTLDRNLGAQMTTQQLSFGAPDEFNKPEHAHKPIIRDTFYRRTNVFFPNGCAATTGAE